MEHVVPRNDAPAIADVASLELLGVGEIHDAIAEPIEKRPDVLGVNPEGDRFAEERELLDGTSERLP